MNARSLQTMDEPQSRTTKNTYAMDRPHTQENESNFAFLLPLCESMQKERTVLFAEQESMYLQFTFAVLVLFASLVPVKDVPLNSPFFILLCFRFSSAVVLFFYIYTRWKWSCSHVVRDLRSGTKYLTWLSNFSIVWFQVAGGLIVVYRTNEGECGKDEFLGMCNENAGLGQLPQTSSFALLLSSMALPILFKTHDIVGWWLMCVVSMSSFSAALLISSRPLYNYFHYSMAMLVTFCVLIENERSNFKFFIAQSKARLYFNMNVAAEAARLSIEGENEHLRSILGNVSHDLKTPLSSFIMEVETLKFSVENALKLCIVASQPLRGFQAICESIAESFHTLESVHSFMMMAINRGIDFSKASAGFPLQSSCGTFDLWETIGWAVKSFGKDTTKVPVRLLSTRNSLAMCPMVISDKHWVKENLMSLVSNAAKFTVAGSVDVSCRLYEAKIDMSELSTVVSESTLSDCFEPTNDSAHDRSLNRVQLNDTELRDSSRSGSGQCSGVRKHLFFLVRVEDSGIGIDTADLGSLFQPFKQAQRKAGGTGLGLFSIAKRMETLGGYCGAQAREDSRPGSCFWLAYPYIPDWETAATVCAQVPASPDILPRPPMVQHMILQRQPQEAGGRQLEQTQGLCDAFSSAVSKLSPDKLSHFPFGLSDPRWKKVLVVEDSPVIVRVLRKHLENQGFIVEVGMNGVAGLSAMQGGSFMLVLSDIQMPVMDGLEMTKRFRLHEQGLGVESPAPYSGHSGDLQVKQFIVGMSANSDVETESAARESGMNDFIVKPVSTTSLRQIIFRHYGL